MIRLRVASPLPEDVEELVHVTIGACIAVHEELGPGLLESIYARAVAIELASRKIPFETEHLIPIVYREQVLGHQRLDLFVDRRVVLEIKSVERLIPLHVAQVLSYLGITKARIGLLVNFNVDILKHGIRRIVL